MSENDDSPTLSQRLKRLNNYWFWFKIKAPFACELLGATMERLIAVAAARPIAMATVAAGRTATFAVTDAAIASQRPVPVGITRLDEGQLDSEGLFHGNHLLSPYREVNVPTILANTEDQAQRNCHPKLRMTRLDNHDNSTEAGT